MKHGSDRVWSVIGVVAVVSLVAVMAYEILVPKPRPTLTTKSKTERLIALDKEVDAVEARLAKSESERARLVNPGTAESVTASLLNRVTLEAKTTGIKLVAFRPQRAETVHNLQSLPYLVIVEGPYPNVLKFVRSLETHEARIAIRTLQLSAADGASDRVNGSLGIVAFAETSEEVKDGAKA